MGPIGASKQNRQTEPVKERCRQKTRHKPCPSEGFGSLTLAWVGALFSTHIPNVNPWSCRLLSKTEEGPYLCLFK